MATTTPNLGLTLPEGTEKVSRTTINANNTLIDTAFGDVQQSIEEVDEKTRSVLLSSDEITLSEGTRISFEDISLYSVVTVSFYAVGGSGGGVRIFSTSLPKRFVDSSKGVSTSHFIANIYYSPSYYCWVEFSIDSNTQMTIRSLNVTGYSSIKGVCMYGTY